MFRGVARDAASLGKDLAKSSRNSSGKSSPTSTRSWKWGARPLKGDEAELILKAADLKASATGLLRWDNGSGPGRQRWSQSSSPTPLLMSPRKSSIISKASMATATKTRRMGKALERRFGGIGYGWERDMLRLVLATLFRAGEIEVTYQGNRFHNYQDPAPAPHSRSGPAFRNSLFSPRQSVGLKTLTQAVQQLEDLTGEEVDVEEGAIATAFKNVAAEELEKLYPAQGSGRGPPASGR